MVRGAADDHCAAAISSLIDGLFTFDRISGGMEWQGTYHTLQEHETMEKLLSATDVLGRRLLALSGFSNSRGFSHGSCGQWLPRSPICIALL